MCWSLWASFVTRHLLSGEIYRQILFLCNIGLFKISKTRIGYQGNHSVLLERIISEKKLLKKSCLPFIFCP